MSRSVDLFIQCAKPIEEVAADLARLARVTLQPGGMPGTWSLDEGEVHAELRAHPYIDDGELMLQRYQYALSCRVASGAQLTNSAEASLLRVVSEALRKGGIVTLLVHDLQYRDRSQPAPGPAQPEEAEAAAPAEGS